MTMNPKERMDPWIQYSLLGAIHAAAVLFVVAAAVFQRPGEI